jgi:hypothetical protein
MRSVSIEFDPPIDMDVKRQLSGALPMTNDVRENMPKQLCVGKPRRGDMPNILGSSMGPWIVSLRVREIIESLEPGVHEYSPIDLVSEDRKRKYGTYFLILPPLQLDAIIDKKTEFSSKSMLKMGGACVLDANVIRGHHLWRAPSPLELTYFCSDELRDQLLAEKLDGWDLRHRCSAEQR